MIALLRSLSTCLMLIGIIALAALAIGIQTGDFLKNPTNATALYAFGEPEPTRRLQ